MITPQSLGLCGESPVVERTQIDCSGPAAVAQLVEHFS